MTKPQQLGWHASIVVLCIWALALIAVGYVRLAGNHEAAPRRVPATSSIVRADIPPPPLTRPGEGPLVRPNNLVYSGAFRVPQGTVGASTFGYGGTAIAINPARNSLFIVGHDAGQLVAEISIPEIRSSANVDGLATATMLQPFTDVTEGKLGTLGAASMKIGGLLAYENRLYASGFLFYDAAKTQVVSHVVSGLDFSATRDVNGPYQVGTVPSGFVSGYFGSIPSAWQEALGGPVLNGNCCLPIVTRTSYGPAVFSIDPAQLGRANPLPATPLVYYPAAHHTLGDWDVGSTLFNGATEIRGVVFPDGTRSVLFFGRQGLGPFCYGVGGESGGDCHDPSDQYKGTHAFPYSYYVWAYDANDLSAVKRGERRPWDVKPYEVWALTLPFADARAHIQGATYDPVRNRLYVSQAFGEGDFPVIHVFSIVVS
jgi:hypothetical protein